MFGHFAAQGIAVDSEHVGGFGQIAIRFGQHAGDESALELAAGIIEADPPGDHFLD